MGKLATAQKSSIHSSNNTSAACAAVIKDSQELSSQGSVISVDGDGRSVLSQISFAALNSSSKIQHLSGQKIGDICHSVFNNLTEGSASSVSQVDQAKALINAGLSPNSSPEESTLTISAVSQTDSSCESDSSKFADAILASGGGNQKQKVVACAEKKKQGGEVCIKKDDPDNRIESSPIVHEKITSDNSGVSWGSPASGVSYGSQASQWFTPMNTRRELGSCQSDIKISTLNDNQTGEIKKILFDMPRNLEEPEQSDRVADKSSQPNQNTVLLSNFENCAAWDSPKPETPRNLAVSQVEAQPEIDLVDGSEQGLSKEFSHSIQKLDAPFAFMKSDFNNQSHSLEISELLPMKAAIKASPTMDTRRKGRVVSAKFLDRKCKSPDGLGAKSAGTKASSVAAEKKMPSLFLQKQLQNELEERSEHSAETQDVAKTTTAKSSLQRETSNLKVGSHARISEKKSLRHDQSSGPSPWNGNKFSWIRTLRSDRAGANGSPLKCQKGNRGAIAQTNCCSHVADIALPLKSQALKSSKKASVLKDGIKTKALKIQGSQGKPNMKGATNHQHMHKPKNQTGFSISRVIQCVRSDISLKPMKDLMQQPINEEKISEVLATELTFSETQSTGQGVVEVKLEVNNEALQNQTKEKQDPDMQQTRGESFLISQAIEKVEERPEHDDAYVCPDPPPTPDNLIAEREFLPKINTARDDHVPCTPRDSGSVKRIADRPNPPPSFDPENFESQMLHF